MKQIYLTLYGENGLRMKKGKRKKMHVIVLVMSVLYLAIVVGATAYCQTVYVQKLPLVTLIKPDKGRVPEKALQGTETTGYFLYTVEQQEGPWGNRYVLKEMAVMRSEPINDDTVFVYEAIDLKKPIACAANIDAFYDGMEVRVQ